jgi:hypothetical protein
MRTQLACPECGRAVVAEFVEPPPRVYDCEFCWTRTPREQLKKVKNMSILRGGSARTPALEFIGSSTSDSAGDSSTISVSGVSVSAGEQIFAAYLSDYGGPHVFNLNGTWGANQVGANPWATDPVTDASLLLTDGDAVLWSVAYNPPHAGSATFSVTELGANASSRVLSVFRVSRVSPTLTGYRAQAEEAFDPPIVLGPTSVTPVVLWCSAVGLRSVSTTGAWSGSDRVRRTSSASLTVDVASSPNRVPFSAEYDGFSSVEGAGVAVGYPT